MKGLEWPHVVVYDASSTVFPHRLSQDIEEERRVFHVAITRCTTSLMITADVEAPSIFLGELGAPYVASREPRRAVAEPSASRGAGGLNPITAEVGLKFQWGGYDFEVRAVELDGVAVSTSGSRTASLPFGWTVKVNEKSRTLVAPTAAKSTRTAGPGPEANPDLYNALKFWRLEQSRADSVPAFAVFNDRTLDELSIVRPRTVGELLGIIGIGLTKLDRYGDQILAIIQESV